MQLVYSMKSRKRLSDKLQKNELIQLRGRIFHLSFDHDIVSSAL